jgi:glycosyltransferase involved in cell wall biosynthesis
VADKKPKILWANPYCMLDTSSGASITIRQILLELHKAGYEVAILGATIFDSPQGTTRLRQHWEKIHASKQNLVIVNDGPLRHRLIKTKSTIRSEMRADEEARWYQAYVSLLEKFKPDIVMYYGGRTLDLLIGDEAHRRGIPVAAFLYNGNFSGKRWCRDVDVILTDSNATAELYREKDDLTVVPVGPFVDPAKVSARNPTPQNILFINPSLAKGALIVAHLATELEREQPDLHFEVIESRGNWEMLVRQLTKKRGLERSALKNVTVTPNTPDMRPIYRRAKAILIPSLWWESFPRVSIEALINEIPSIITKRGGLPEAMGNAAHAFDVESNCYVQPYNRLPSSKVLEKMKEKIIDLNDQGESYSVLKKEAGLQKLKYSLTASRNRLEKAIKKVL